jgi:hypothetical protein
MKLGELLSLFKVQEWKFGVGGELSAKFCHLLRNCTGHYAIKWSELDERRLLAALESEMKGLEHSRLHRDPIESRIAIVEEISQIIVNDIDDLDDGKIERLGDAFLKPIPHKFMGAVPEVQFSTSECTCQKRAFLRELRKASIIGDPQMLALFDQLPEEL